MCIFYTILYCCGGAAVFFSFGFLWFSLVFFWFSSGFLLFSLGFLLFSLGFLLFSFVFFGFSCSFKPKKTKENCKKTIRKLKKTIRNATLENRGRERSNPPKTFWGQERSAQKSTVNNRTSALRACVRYKARKAYSGVLRYRPYPRLELKLYLFPYLCLSSCLFLGELTRCGPPPRLALLPPGASIEDSCMALSFLVFFSFHSHQPCPR